MLRLKNGSVHERVGVKKVTVTDDLTRISAREHFESEGKIRINVSVVF